MAQLYPFRALRYDTSLVEMADVVTQPYDKITPEMQDRYYAASPHNLIRVVYGKHEAADTDEENVYTRAAATLQEWRADGVLKEEAEPAIFGYSQTYTVPSTSEVRERRGFIALGHLYDYADHVVYRHEQTFPKHKSDRLALFKATRTYCEQIYMLYSDPTFAAEQVIFGDGAAPDLEIVDEYDVLHRVWKVTDPQRIQHAMTAMGDKKLIIADGHHRYETSVTYMQERAAALGKPLPSVAVTDANGLPQPAFPEAAMMMTFVNMDAPGITILPTHRVVFGPDSFDGNLFARSASEYFTVTPVVATDAAGMLAALDEASGIAFVALTAAGTFLLTPIEEKVAPLLANLSVRRRDLDVVQLHAVVLEKLLLLDEAAVRAGTNVRYLRDAADAVRQVSAGTANVAFLIKPVTLEQMKDISLNLEVMPQKSTDFYPKLLSGLAMYTLD